MDNNANFYAVIARRRASNAAAPCIESDSGEIYSFDDIDRLSARYAHALLALGCEVNDRVAAQVEKSPQAVFLYLGCLRAGCVFLPMRRLISVLLPTAVNRPPPTANASAFGMPESTV